MLKFWVLKEILSHAILITVVNVLYYCSIINSLRIFVRYSTLGKEREDFTVVTTAILLSSIVTLIANHIIIKSLKETSDEYRFLVEALKEKNSDLEKSLL